MRLEKTLCLLAALGCSQVLLLASNPGTQADSRSDEHRLSDEMRATGWKAENGLLMSWRATSSQRSQPQVTIQDVQGHFLCSAQVLGLVPEASSVSIYDVSAQPGRLIAIGAVFDPSNEKQAPVDTLLYFDFNGRLVSAYALEPSREIRKVSLDENLNAWTVTAHSGGKYPSETYFVIEYDARGQTKRMLVPRSTFPLHSKQITEDPRTGGVYSGYTNGSFWFWLPGSADLVTINTENGSVSKVRTGLPANSIPLRIVGRDRGNLVAEVRVGAPNITVQSPSYYVWAQETGKWLPASSICAGYNLIGRETDNESFVRPSDGSYCRTSVQP